MVGTRARFLTLTYRLGTDWQPRHVTGASRIRHWVQHRGVRFRYVWVAEQHKSGRVHYHAIVWLLRGLTMPKPDKQGWWPHGFTNVQWARKGIAYLVKYATKTATSSVPFPRGCRSHGHGGLKRRAARLSVLVDAAEVSTRTLRACRPRSPSSRRRLAFDRYRRVVGVSCLLSRRVAAVRPSLLQSVRSRTSAEVRGTAKQTLNV